MNMPRLDPAKFISAAKSAPTPVLVFFIGVTIVVPITMQHDRWIVLPLVGLLLLIVFWLISSNRGR
jgi:hypothetical protein